MATMDLPFVIPYQKKKKKKKQSRTDASISGE
jgi:hypothetical protein